MGALTATEIVSEGQLLAGRDDNATASLRWLQRWLDSVAASWPWPVLQEESVGISLSAGSASLVVGGGSGGISERMHKLLDNVWIYNTDRTFKRRIRIRHQLGMPSDRIDPTTRVGVPDTARLFSSAYGVWTLRFEPTPDRDYLLTIPYIRVPDAITGADTPWYPNDETMVQVVAFKNHEFYDGKDSPVTQAAQQALGALVANDRIRYGSISGVNDSMILDPTVFRPRRS